MTGSFSPGRAHFAALALGFADHAYSVGEDRELLRSARKRMAVLQTVRARHLRKHRVNEQRSLFRDVSGAYYWWVLKSCGCGWRHEFLERRLRADEWHAFVVHGGAPSDQATQHPLSLCAKINR